jgi:hypothetical protein
MKGRVNNKTLEDRPEAFQVYLDSSGHSQDPNCSYLTLTAITGSDSIWRQLERCWQKALDDYEVPCAHMCELAGGNGAFRGWPEDRKVAFAKELLRCLIQHDRSALIACIATVDLREYRKCSTGRNTKPPEAVCVDACMSLVLAHPNFEHGTTEILFDMNERFIRHLHWTWSRFKSDSSSWASYIANVQPVEMKVSIPIQAADLLAWATNRRYAPPKLDFWRHMLDHCILAMPCYQQFYGQAELVTHPGFYGWPGDSVNSVEVNHDGHHTFSTDLACQDRLKPSAPHPVKKRKP